MSGEPTVDESDLTPRELKLVAYVTLARVDLLDLLKVCGIETAGTMAFGEDLVAVRKYVENLKAALSLVPTTIPKSSPLEVELILALSSAIGIIEHEVPPKAFEANTGPDADGDDANAFYLGQTLRRIRATLEKARGEEGPATAVSRMLGELPSK